MFKHAEQDERVRGAMVLDHVNAGVNVKNLLQRVRKRQLVQTVSAGSRGANECPIDVCARAWLLICQTPQHWLLCELASSPNVITVDAGGPCSPQYGMFKTQERDYVYIANKVNSFLIGYLGQEKEIYRETEVQVLRLPDGKTISITDRHCATCRHSCARANSASWNWLQIRPTGSADDVQWPQDVH